MLSIQSIPRKNSCYWVCSLGPGWWGLFFGNSPCYSQKKKHPFKNPATSPRNKRILLKIWECLFPKVLQRKNIWWVVIWYNPFHWLRGKNWYYCKWRNSRISFNAQSSETLHFGLTKSYSQWHHPQLHGNQSTNPRGSCSPVTACLTWSWNCESFKKYTLIIHDFLILKGIPWEISKLGFEIMKSWNHESI